MFTALDLQLVAIHTWKPGMADKYTQTDQCLEGLTSIGQPQGQSGHTSHS